MIGSSLFRCSASEDLEHKIISSTNKPNPLATLLIVPLREILLGPSRISFGSTLDSCTGTSHIDSVPASPTHKPNKAKVFTLASQKPISSTTSMCRIVTCQLISAGIGAISLLHRSDISLNKQRSDIEATLGLLSMTSSLRATTDS